MKNPLFRSLILFTLLAAMLSVAVWAISRASQQPNMNQQSGVINGKRKSLRELAKETDIEVTPIGENTQAGSIQSLKQSAIAIVLGRITEEQAYFDGDDSIVTSYTVNIQRVLKDDTANWPYPAEFTPPVPLTSPLKVVRVGGELRVNGHRASMKVEGSESLKPNKDYVLFLRWSPDFKAYLPVGGVSGFFIVDGSSGIKPVGTRPNIKKYDGVTLQSFVDVILHGGN